MVTAENAIKISEDFVLRTFGRALKRYSITFIDPDDLAEGSTNGLSERDRAQFLRMIKREWAVSFEPRFGCGDDEIVCDGAVVVTVDAETGEVVLQEGPL